jgi:hypothetical protein
MGVRSAGLCRLLPDGFGAFEAHFVAINDDPAEDQLHIGLPQLGRPVGQTPAYLDQQDLQLLGRDPACPWRRLSCSRAMLSSSSSLHSRKVTSRSSSAGSSGCTAPTLPGAAGAGRQRRCHPALCVPGAASPADRRGRPRCRRDSLPAGSQGARAWTVSATDDRAPAQPACPCGYGALGRRSCPASWLVSSSSSSTATHRPCECSGSWRRRQLHTRYGAQPPRAFGHRPGSSGHAAP